MNSATSSLSVSGSTSVDLDFVTRDMVEDDRNFIFSSYLRENLENYPTKLTPRSLYWKPQSADLEKILTTSKAVVACFPEEPAEIAGYALFEDGPIALTLHYIYVKRKKLGVGRGLFDAIVGDRQLIIATHICDSFVKLREKVLPRRVVYVPYAHLGRANGGDYR